MIPDGYSIKKVTKAQERAVKSKRVHDNVVEVLKNPEIIKQILVTIVGYLAVREGQEALQDLKSLGVNISQDVESAYTKKRQVKGAPIGVSLEQIVNYAIDQYSPFE